MYYIYIPFSGLCAALQVGRLDLKRSALAQGRQAFRRARVAVPQKLLLGSNQARRRRNGGSHWELQPMAGDGIHGKNGWKNGKNIEKSEFYMGKMMKNDDL